MAWYAVYDLDTGELSNTTSHPPPRERLDDLGLDIKEIELPQRGEVWNPQTLQFELAAPSSDRAVLEAARGLLRSTGQLTAAQRDVLMRAVAIKLGI